MDNNKFYYIYNLDQANYFLSNNIQPIKVGIGKRGDFYVKFIKNDDVKEVFNKWCELCNNKY